MTLADINLNLAKARKEFNSSLATLQIACKHLHLVEANYAHCSYTASSPPFRTCLECELSEEGWGCGYIVLKGDAPVMTRDELYKMRSGLFIKDEDKGPLLRKEITLTELIRKHYELP